MLFRLICGRCGQVWPTSVCRCCRLQFACGQSHRRDATLANAGDEGGAIGESSSFAPQAEPDSIGRIVDVRGTSGRGINHAGARQAVLQYHANNALLRTLSGAGSAFTASDATQRMGLVERNQTIKFGRQPFEQLLKSGLVWRAAAQRRIGCEKDAFRTEDLGLGFELRKRLNIEHHAASPRWARVVLVTPLPPKRLLRASPRSDKISQ